MASFPDWIGFAAELLNESDGQGQLFCIGDDDADSVVELDVKMAGGDFGEGDFDVANVLHRPRFGQF